MRYLSALAHFSFTHCQTTADHCQLHDNTALCLTLLKSAHSMLRLCREASTRLLAMVACTMCCQQAASGCCAVPRHAVLCCAEEVHASNSTSYAASLSLLATLITDAACGAARCKAAAVKPCCACHIAFSVLTDEQKLKNSYVMLQSIGSFEDYDA